MKKPVIIILPILILFLGCSSVTDDELYNSAQKNIKEEKYEEALKDFEQIVNEFPESPYYVESLFEIGKLYHGWAIKNISQKESLSKAVDYYQKVYDLKPEGKYAEQSLFMVGFIQANEIDQLESARITYNLFMKKFPDSELTPSAKAELENLGIPPEKILQNAAENPE